MKQSTLLGIAAALTAFVLVVVGALAGRLTQTSAAATPTVVEATTAPTDAVVALDPTVEALIREREAAYQRALAEANRQLAEANRRLEEASRQGAQSQSSASLVSPQNTPAYPISAEQAQTIALNLAQGAAPVKPAELVIYRGAPAYEVVFAAGAVYVDAQNGAVLANTLAQPAMSQPVSAEQAAQIAIAYRGGGQVRKVERENERGLEVYEVKFTDGAEVYVAASDGAVVYARLDKAKDGEDDDHDD
ncbi:MAG: PepSY domain-containing protein [Roseiflexaceae bacterium]|nr:PepSY domain-containing protein [Roseiflexus sp.]MDW8213993.1 PepSY domain-containing protein [Roseiflexaceae bacterium]